MAELDDLLGTRPLTYEESIGWFQNKMDENINHLSDVIKTGNIENAEHIFSNIKRGMKQINLLTETEFINNVTNFKSLTIEEITKIIRK